MAALSVDDVLGVLRSRDRQVAGDAESALTALTGGEGPEVITQARVQQFCWYTLPVKYLTDTVRHHQIASAAAEALDLLGLDRYAEICRSEVTAKVIDAFGESMAAGRRAYRAADAASGLHPPVIDGFEFGSVMGLVEAEAWDSTADRLEMAIVAGDLVPGGRGWKARQVALVEAHLSDPDRHDGTGSLLDAIRAERFGRWQGGIRSDTRKRLFEPLLDRLVEPISPPGDAARVAGERLGWLLEQFADGGQRLTQTGNLNQALVRMAAPRFAYPDSFTAPTSEHDVVDLHLVRDFAQTRRLVRTTKGSMVLTTVGKAALGDPDKLWRHVAEGLIPADPFDRATGTIALALLVTNDRVDRDLLTETATTIIREEGWHSPDTGEAPDEGVIVTSWYSTTNLVRALGLMVPSGEGFLTSELALSPGGQRVALDALRWAATGPRDRP